MEIDIGLIQMKNTSSYSQIDIKEIQEDVSLQTIINDNSISKQSYDDIVGRLLLAEFEKATFEFETDSFAEQDER